MSDILAEIIARKRSDIAQWRIARPLGELEAMARDQPPTRGFAKALKQASAGQGIGLIAEIKKASPSHGLIRPAFDPAEIARTYAAAGAACLSVLTDAHYFQGSNGDLQAARAAVALPLLRKDFIVDPWQVAEARAIGADCILLIMAALDDAEAAELEHAARDYGLDVLIEVHDRSELDRALSLRSPLLGINNRNLKTLVTRLETSIELASQIPANRIGISESGISEHEQIQRLADAGLRCFLVGEALLRHADVGLATRALLGRAA